MVPKWCQKRLREPFREMVPSFTPTGRAKWSQEAGKGPQMHPKIIKKSQQMLSEGTLLRVSEKVSKHKCFSTLLGRPGPLKSCKTTILSFEIKGTTFSTKSSQNAQNAPQNESQWIPKATKGHQNAPQNQQKHALKTSNKKTQKRTRK